MDTKKITELATEIDGIDGVIDLLQKTMATFFESNTKVSLLLAFHTDSDLVITDALPLVPMGEQDLPQEKARVMGVQLRFRNPTDYKAEVVNVHGPGEQFIPALTKYKETLLKEKAKLEAKIDKLAKE